MAEKSFMERIVELHAKLGEMGSLRREFQFPRNRKEEDVGHDYQELNIEVLKDMP